MGSREWEEKSIGMLETILMNIAIKEGNHILAEEVELRIEGRKRGSKRGGEYVGK